MQKDYLRSSTVKIDHKKVEREKAIIDELFAISKEVGKCRKTQLN